MIRYEIINQITGRVYGYYEDREEANEYYEHCLKIFTDPELYSFTLVELPEVEEPELDYQYIDCLINEMIEDMAKICRLANLDYISLNYFITENKDTGASMSAWSGESHGIAVISDNTNRTNIFERIHNQIKGEQIILNKIKEKNANV